jgi:hypothetical protein
MNAFELAGTVEFGLEAKQGLLDCAPRTLGCGSSPG